MNLGFPSKFNSNVLQNNIYATISDDNIMTIKNLYLYVPTIVPHNSTQFMFNNSVKDSFRLSYASWIQIEKLFIQVWNIKST